ncbi:hypothetical protein PVA44_03770 [Entomospira nematocerorum]|nr:hypothetical protein PVA44_03770 [Entomospira nematocera]
MIAKKVACIVGVFLCVPTIFALFEDPAMIIESYVARIVPKDMEIGMLYGLNHVDATDAVLWRVIDGIRRGALPSSVIADNSRVLVFSQLEILQKQMIPHHVWRLASWQYQGDYALIPARIITRNGWMVVEFLFSRDKQQLLGILVTEDR